jgi:hypothetical protein
MSSTLRVDELNVYPHPIAAAQNASLECVAYIQLGADRPHVDRLPLERKGGVPGNYERSSDPRQVGGQAVRHGVDEIFLLGIFSRRPDSTSLCSSGKLASNIAADALRDDLLAAEFAGLSKDQFALAR